MVLNNRACSGMSIGRVIGRVLWSPTGCDGDAAHKRQGGTEVHQTMRKVAPHALEEQIGSSPLNLPQAIAALACAWIKKPEKFSLWPQCNCTST